MAIVICIWNSLLKDLWGQLLTGKIAAAAVAWSFLMECHCRAAPAALPACQCWALLLRNSQWAPAGQDWSRQGRQGLRGARDRKYITAFYRKRSGSQNAGKRCCFCPPILPEIQFSQSSPHLPRAYLLLQLQGQSGSRAWKLEFFQLKTAELPFSQQHPKLALSDNFWTLVWEWWCPEEQLGNLTEWKYLPLGILLARCWCLWMLCNT